MTARGYVLEQGLRDTRAALVRWQGHPWPVLRGWLLWSTAVALGLFAAVWAVSSVATPDPTSFYIAGLSGPATAGDMGGILARNSLVLALHGFACVAGFGISPGLLLLTAVPHALPELVALFLPLAAWLIASRRGGWADLLAATIVTVTIAVPVLLISAAIELLVWPDLLRAATGAG